MNQSTRSKFVTILTTLLSLNSVSSHMMMNHPSVWGYFDASMENPLNMGYSRNDWFCHGKQKQDRPPLTLTAGSSVSFKVTCGEAGESGDGGQCQNDPNALHNGGGCAISIDYSGDGKNFKTISVASDCPNGNYQPIKFDIPANLPACKNCACAWTWVPPSSGAAEESYMNCFSCSVESSVTGSDIEAEVTEFYYVQGGSTPKDGKRTYNDRYPNGGALKVTPIGGSQVETPSPTVNQTNSDPPVYQPPAEQPKPDPPVNQSNPDPPADQPKSDPPASQPKSDPPASQPKTDPPADQPKSDPPAYQPKSVPKKCRNKRKH